MATTKLVKGNTAVVIGALYGGCESFFGYPITPASEIAHEASTYFPEFGRVFLQAESETASINMLYGAAGAGRRAMTASSGPGISLMQEGFSYLAGAELPAVVVDIVRAGPGLGNIGPEQSDYNQIVKGGGHGTYRNIVLAPASVQEMCDFTCRAFDLAFEHRNPVVVLADAVLGQMMEPLTLPGAAVHPEPSMPWGAVGERSRENVVTSIYLDFDELEELNRKLIEKYSTIQKKGGDAEHYGNDDADLTVVAYGCTSRIARSAVARCRAQGLSVGLLRPKTLFPFPLAELQALAGPESATFLVPELSDGQFAADVRMFLEYARPVHQLNRYGGNLITVEEIEARVKQILSRPL